MIDIAQRMIDPKTFLLDPTNRPPKAAILGEPAKTLLDLAKCALDLATCLLGLAKFELDLKTQTQVGQ